MFKTIAIQPGVLPNNITELLHIKRLFHYQLNKNLSNKKYSRIIVR